MMYTLFAGAHQIIQPSSRILVKNKAFRIASIHATNLGKHTFTSVFHRNLLCLRITLSLDEDIHYLTSKDPRNKDPYCKDPCVDPLLHMKIFDHFVVYITSTKTIVFFL
jgi:hypothetical protein